MLIKITRGNFGYNSADGFSVKTPRDEPFEVSEYVAGYLVERGIAEIIGNAVATGAEAAEDDSETDNATKAEAPVSVENEEETDKCLEDMTVQELKEVASENGIKIGARASKAAIIEAILSADADMPELTAEDFV